MTDVIGLLIAIAYIGILIGFGALLAWHQDNYTSKD